MVELKRCSYCKFEKPLSKFHKDKSRKDGLNHRCKACNTIRQTKRDREKRAANPQQHRQRQRVYELQHHYGMTEADYDALVLKQNGVCAICGEAPEQYLAVDHDHKTGRNRGLLCRTCNSAIGLLKDDPEVLQSAASYLQSWG